jgi:hypothetical protein
VVVPFSFFLWGIWQGGQWFSTWFVAHCGSENPNRRFK